MRRRMLDRFGGRSKHDPSVFDRIANVAAHQLPNRVVQQQILSTFTDRLDDLAPPEELITRGRSLAIIEIALNRDTDARQHMYLPGHGERTLTVRNDIGDTAMVWTGNAGSVVRGFDYQSDMAPAARDRPAIWPRLLDGFPPSLADGPKLDSHEDVENVTFCYWWFGGGPCNRGVFDFPDKTDTDPDGSWHLLRTVSSDKEALRFLGDTYGGHFSDDILDHFARPRVFQGMLQTLDLDRSLDRVMEDLTDAGYVV